MKDRSRLDRIPSEDLTAYEKWEMPLLDGQGNEVAREEERNVKPLTARDIEEIRQAAWDDGHAEGREEGLRRGHEEGRAEGHKEGFDAGQAEGQGTGREEAIESTKTDVGQKLERLEDILGQLLDPIQRHEDELETALFNLATVLARAVIFRELSLDSSHIRHVVRQAMASLPSTRENVKIRVNPADLEWVREVAERYESDAAVLEDESILPGGCKVETRHSLVDFTVEKRFQKAVQGMLDQQLSSDEPGDSAELDAMMGDLTDFHRDVLSEPAEPAEPAKPAEPAEPAKSSASVDVEYPESEAIESSEQPEHSEASEASRDSGAVPEAGRDEEGSDESPPG
ncbi:flagellar assembly protein FliH [Marinobacter caseinilyticus]|uniref:flagellar assembly protein FliH n=1 Tax=Marinobacter caseinilyticus TaxID=2692195 RepID=UPI00140BBA95|nr:flagellar assembly protein FliH [Marinobacter caseinilyticus]